MIRIAKTNLTPCSGTQENRNINRFSFSKVCYKFKKLRPPKTKPPPPFWKELTFKVKLAAIYSSKNILSYEIPHDPSQYQGFFQSR